MKTYKKEQQEVQVIDKAFCNACAEEIDCDWGNWYHGRYSGGYDSIIGDMAEYAFDLCEECLAKLFKSFKIDAYVGDDDD